MPGFLIESPHGFPRFCGYSSAEFGSSSFAWRCPKANPPKECKKCRSKFLRHLLTGISWPGACTAAAPAPSLQWLLAGISWPGAWTAGRHLLAWCLGRCRPGENHLAGCLWSLLGWIWLLLICLGLSEHESKKSKKFSPAAPSPTEISSWIAWASLRDIVFYWNQYILMEKVRLQEHLTGHPVGACRHPGTSQCIIHSNKSSSFRRNAQIYVQYVHMSFIHECIHAHPTRLKVYSASCLFIFGQVFGMMFGKVVGQVFILEPENIVYSSTGTENPVWGSTGKEKRGIWLTIYYSEPKKPKTVFSVDVRYYLDTARNNLFVE